MRLLLDDRLAPITSEIGFVEAEAQRAAQAFVEWQREREEPLPLRVRVGRRLRHPLGERGGLVLPAVVLSGDGDGLREAAERAMFEQVRRLEREYPPPLLPRIRWRLRHPFGMEETFAVREVSGDLERLLRTLLPLTDIEPRRYLFVPTRAPWTAYFDNGYDGTGAVTTSLLAERLGCRALRAVAVPHTMREDESRGRWGATILELYGPQRTEFLNYVRTIAAVNDGGGWVFEESGDPLPFEDVERYRARRRRDRFTPELLDRYLRELGVRAFEDDFYAPEGRAILVENRGPTLPRTRRYSLEERRASF